MVVMWGHPPQLYLMAVKRVYQSVLLCLYLIRRKKNKEKKKAKRRTSFERVATAKWRPSQGLKYSETNIFSIATAFGYTVIKKDFT